MSDTMWGADAEQLEQLGTQIDGAVDTLRTTAQTLNQAILSSSWDGGDAETFRSDWTSIHRLQIESAAQHLTEASEVLRRNAGGQRQASDSAGGGAGGPVGSGAGTGAEAADGPPPLGDSLRGTDPQEVDADLAALSKSVYGDPSDSGVPDGYEALSASELEALGIDPGDLDHGGLLDLGSGFQAAVYRDPNGNLVLTFAGTDLTSPVDWATNVEQAIGIETKQYNAALELATKLKAEAGSDLVITGHSLGGGLASYAALGTDTPAVTFNAAGLSNDSLESLGYSPDQAREVASDGLIRRYSVQSDILTNLQENTPAPDAVGTHIELRDPESNDLFDTHSIDMHGSGAVVDAINKDKPWND